MRKLITRRQGGQSTVEYALICMFILIVITATMLRFTSLPNQLGQQIVDQLVFQLGRHWRGVLTFF